LIHRIRRFVLAGESFALETTCSGKSYIPFLRDCRDGGWTIKLLYFWLPSPEASLRRVANRVAHGGHDIPAEAIYRRFRSGLRNMVDLYLPLADEAEIYDNSDRSRVLIAERRRGEDVIVTDSERWARIQEAIR
jgi:predicted ABC-type ATPase